MGLFSRKSQAEKWAAMSVDERQRAFRNHALGFLHAFFSPRWKDVPARKLTQVEEAIVDAWIDSGFDFAALTLGEGQKIGDLLTAVTEALISEVTETSNPVDELLAMGIEIARKRGRL